MTRNLFIVTDNGIHIGRERLHKKLADKLEIPHQVILGGGCFDQKTHEDNWVLFGRSGDFGKVDADLLQHFIDNDEVFWLGAKLSRRAKVGLLIDDEREETEADSFD